MQTEQIVNLVQEDWTSHNRQVLKFCKEEAEKSVTARLADYPATHHRASVRGNMLWDQVDYFLERAAVNGLFEGITHKWVKYKGADILELRGKYTSLTAKHVLTKDEELQDSEQGYRTNNKKQNQKNLELFKEFESESDDDALHIVMQHGGKNEIFAYLKAYFPDSSPLTLSENMMLLADLEMADESELVLQPSVTLKQNLAQEEPATPPIVAVQETEDEHSQP